MQSKPLPTILYYVIYGQPLTIILHYCDTQCTAVSYNDWSLRMGQMGPKMTLGTLTLSGDDIPGV